MTQADRGAPSRDSTRGYRPALDGIRAVAVLAVIAYHFNYRWAPGGFLGVDVFFVLSGYLITSLLLAEHSRTGRIALRDFWLRRARRLLPALFVLLIAVAIWIGLTASPFELPMRRDDLLWTLFYGSNWHFIASGQDYFAQYASASPLRHTWSLAIEEQFYVIWPVLVAGTLWISRKRPVILAAVCVVGVVASGIAMAVLFNPSDPSRAYFGTDARMHQLLIGALLAVLMRKPGLSVRAGRVASVVAPVAAAVLLVAFVTVHDQNAAYYRGLSVLLASTSAILVWAIESNPRSVVARALSLRPVAWVGQISYGLYLWHWPVILAITSAPGPLANLPGATTGLNLTRLAATFGIEIVSFYLVEQPLRRGRMPVIGRSARRFAAAAAASIVVVSGVSLAATSAASPALSMTQVPDCPPFTICVRHQGPAGAPVLAVIGDSIARSLDPAFVAIAAEHGWTYVLQANGSCRVGHLEPSDVTATNAAELALCWEKTPGQQHELAARWHPELIVMVDLMETLDIRGPDGATIVRGSDEAIALSRQALAEVAVRMTTNGTRLALLKLPPRLGKDCSKASNFTAPDCTFKYNPKPGGTGVQARYDAMYDRLAATIPRVSSISITSGVCPQHVCEPAVDGVMLRYDGVHFTAPGALAMVTTLDGQLRSIGALP